MSVLLSHIAFSIPIVVLMVMPLYQEMDSSLIDAANDLGANSSQIMREITLPYLTPGIIAGFFMAFTYSLDDFAVTSLSQEMISQPYQLKSIPELAPEFL